jgi:hypothetical protein
MNDVNWVEVFYIVFGTIIIISLIILYRYYTTPILNITNNSNLEDIKNKLNTGDLLFLEYNSTYSKLINIFTRTRWSHVSFVYKTKKGIYIIEVTYYKSTNFSGLCVIPIDKWFDINQGHKCGFKKLETGKISKQVINKLLKDYKNIRLDLNLIHWLRPIFKKNYSKSNKIKTEYFCSEFIALLLQELGILKCKYTPDSYKPIDLYNLENYSSIDFIFEIPENESELSD